MNVFAELIYAFSPSVDGFLFMWLIAFLFIAYIVLFAERWIFLRSIGNVHPEKFALQIRKLLAEDKAEEALALCESGGKRGLPQIAGAALRNREFEPRMMKSGVEEVVVSLTSQVERKLEYFATIGNIATLLGLMGTIYGLILAFAAVGKPDVAAAVKTAMLANGISTAMNTTLLGLLLAVPCMMTYSYFQNWSNHLVGQFDKQTVGILNALFKADVNLKNYKPSDRRRKGVIDTDLDLTPIMGLMVVLIPLLLTSAEFVKIGKIEMNLPKSGRGGSESASDEKPRNLNLGLIITKTGIEIQNDLTGTKTRVGLKGKDYDYLDLTRKLLSVKKAVLGEMQGMYGGNGGSLYQMSRWAQNMDPADIVHYKDFETIKVVAENKTDFQRIINIMDAARSATISGNVIPLFPTVAMGAGI